MNNFLIRIIALFTTLIFNLAIAALQDAEAKSSNEKLSATQIEQLTDKHRARLLNFYREFLTFPNDANKPDDIAKLMTWVEQAFEARQFQTRRLSTAAIPMVLAERQVDNATGTILIYLQADGQPVQPEYWYQTSPFSPVVKRQDDRGIWRDESWSALLSKSSEETADWRIFARSASDSKGPMAQFIYALGVLNDINQLPDFNLKVLVDFEEELGSPNIREAVKTHKAVLAADTLLVFDGPPHFSNLPTLNFGARGIMTLQLEVFGPRQPQHSGHMGNYVPNPAFKLATLLGSMKGLDGKVLIEDFYQGIALTAEQKRTFAAIPDDLDALKRIVGFASADAVGANLQEAMQYPSLNIRGMSAAFTEDQVRTIIPATALAEIDIRLVTSSSPQHLLNAVRQHIAKQGFYILEDREPTEKERMTHSHLIRVSHDISYGAFATDMQSNVGKFLQAALVRQYNAPPLMVQTIGGSVPISPLVDELGIPAVLVPTVNMDNNQHSPNENIRLGHFMDGFGTVLAVMTEPMAKHFN